MSLSIKNFTVLNTTSGQMSTSGRYTTSQIDTILSYDTFINDTVERQTIAGTPTTIDSSEMLYGKAHMSTSYIQCVTSFIQKVSSDCVYIPYNIIRFTYIGGTTSASNSLLYGFASSSTIPISSITFNVLIAKNTSQTIGDYWDVEVPDPTFYPSLYIVLILVNSAWDTRTIVSGNICSISTVNAPNYCINPSQSLYDVSQSHFIVSQCINTINSLPSRITISMEDWIFNPVGGYTDLADRDYNDIIISIGSIPIDDTLTNDTLLS